MALKLKETAIEALTKLGLANQISVIDGQPYASLATGYKIPQFGLGTWSGGPEAEDRGLTYKAVKEAIKIGYRHIDCAWTYHNEDEVGQALTESFKEGLIKREDIFITTKLWVNFYEPEKAKETFKKQLKDLQLEYLDLYLMHNPYPGKPGTPENPPHQETWKALEELVDEGLIRTIGVSNFSIKKIQNLQKYAKKPIAVNQVEIHPLWNNKKLADWCIANNIHVTAYSPLGAASSDGMRTFKLNRALEQPIIKSLAEKYGATTAQVALRWGLQRGLSIVPKSTNPDRIKANFEALNVELTSDDIKAIDSISPQVRALRFSFFYKPEGPYKKYEDLFDEPDVLLDYLKATGQEKVWEDSQKDGVPISTNIFQGIK